MRREVIDRSRRAVVLYSDWDARLAAVRMRAGSGRVLMLSRRQGRRRAAARVWLRAARRRVWLWLWEGGVRGS